MKRLLLAGMVGIAFSNSAWAFPSYASGNGIWGADLMTSEERQQYVHNIQGMKSFQECQGYLEGHRKEIQARAAAKNVNLAPPPSRSPCDVMQFMGRFSKSTSYVPSSTPPAK